MHKRHCVVEKLEGYEKQDDIIPDAEESKIFWGNIWDQGTQHNEKAKWLFNIIIIIIFDLSIFAQAVLTADNFLLGESQLVTNVQEVSFTFLELSLGSVLFPTKLLSVQFQHSPLYPVSLSIA